MWDGPLHSNGTVNVVKYGHLARLQWILFENMGLLLSHGVECFTLALSYCFASPFNSTPLHSSPLHSSPLLSFPLLSTFLPLSIRLNSLPLHVRPLRSVSRKVHATLSIG